MRLSPLLAFVATLTVAGAAHALPQFAVRSARACDTCHVAPDGWEDPELALRKCSLNCNVCHVSPTGGGMRNESGIFYGKQTLPTWGDRPADQAYQTVELVPSSQPIELSEAPESQPGGQPASQPAHVPAPGTAGRYAGIEPHPTLQIGADGRMMYYVPFAEEEDTAIFPMQADVYLAYRPYNPGKLNVGRVTLLVNAGFQGSRGEEFDAFYERAFVREWFAMYHDLPNQLYVRAGRFLPPHGWRTEDHTPFVRQGQLILGQPHDFERQVTGVEVGINPNYLYAHLMVFNAADQWDEPIDPDGGYGTAASVGWRDLWWQLGGSAIYGTRDDGHQIAYSAQWALNFEQPGWIPFSLIYLGEFHLNHTFPETGRNGLGLSAFHELDYLAFQGFNTKLRYDWFDADTEIQYDTGHRLTFGFEWHVYTYAEIQATYRHNWTNTEERFDSGQDEFFVQLHGWY
ncbi:MAG: hypothetical protein H6704_03035 [Myxococcales bacterium]|nr:hypothetical protein [Myxococcales bacterium]